jgi:hypothetical protein
VVFFFRLIVLVICSHLTWALFTPWKQSTGRLWCRKQYHTSGYAYGNSYMEFSYTSNSTKLFS